MMQSVPVLILVLCCMASAHRAIHNIMATRHLEARQDCSFPPDDYPKNCLAFFNLFNNTFNGNSASAILEGFCEDQDCTVPLNDYYKCDLGFDSYSDFFCARHNNEYCLVTLYYVDDACNYCTNNGTCPATCRSCLSRYVDDLSCCIDQYRRISFLYVVFPDLDFQDECGNTYDTCSTSGGAIAVPTVLTALLLMVMAAIVM